MNVSKLELDNGIPVIYFPVSHMNSFTQMCIVRGGSMYETAKVNGISHFLEHMMFKGTKKRPTAKSISYEIDGMGAKNNAFTTSEIISFCIKAPEGRFDQVTNILSDQILNSKLEAQEIELEKGPVLQELKESLSDPYSLVFEILKPLMYGNQATGRTILGTKDTILSLSRRQIKSYADRYFVNQNVIIMVAGKLPKEKDILKILNEYYAGVRKGIPPKRYKFHDLKQKEPKIRLEFRDIEQSYIALGMHAVPRLSKDYHALIVLDSILGSGMSSRLFLEVRERKGLAYSVGSGNTASIDFGSMYIYGGMNSDNLIDALKIIRDELRKLKEKKISVQELDKVRNSIDGSNKMFWDNHIGYAEELAIFLLKYGITIDLKVELELIKMVSAEEIQSLAQKLFNTNNFNLAIVGPNLKYTEEEIINAIFL